jgi:(2Fe-2S) ferredoxin
MMAYYQKHVFFCTNQRDADKKCCADGDAASLRAYAKALLKGLGAAGKGKVRISQSGCLGRCSEGPLLVIYPDAVWYTYHSQDDIDEILFEEILHNRRVERLLLTDSV